MKNETAAALWCVVFVPEGQAAFDFSLPEAIYLSNQQHRKAKEEQTCTAAAWLESWPTLQWKCQSLIFFPHSWCQAVILCCYWSVEMVLTLESRFRKFWSTALEIFSSFCQNSFMYFLRLLSNFARGFNSLEGCQILQEAWTALKNRSRAFTKSPLSAMIRASLLLHILMAKKLVVKSKQFSHCILMPGCWREFCSWLFSSQQHQHTLIGFNFMLDLKPIISCHSMAAIQWQQNVLKWCTRSKLLQHRCGVLSLCLKAKQISLTFQLTWSHLP